MPARKVQQTIIRSNLAEVRVKKGVTQEDLARVVGISMRTLARLEQRRLAHPLLAWYINCALALDVRLEDVVEESDLRWQYLSTTRGMRKAWKCVTPHDATDPAVTSGTSLVMGIRASALSGEPAKAVQEGVLCRVRAQELVEDADEEADRAPPARQPLRRGEEDAAVVDVRDQGRKVSPVLGDDGAPLGRHECEELLVSEAHELDPLRDGDDVVPELPELLGDLFRVELVEQQPQAPMSSCSWRQAVSASSPAVLTSSA